MENPPADNPKPKKLITKKPKTDKPAPSTSKAKTSKAKSAADTKEGDVVTLETLEIDLAPEDVEALAIASALAEAIDDDEIEGWKPLRLNWIPMMGLVKTA